MTKMRSGVHGLRHVKTQAKQNQEEKKVCDLFYTNHAKEIPEVLMPILTWPTEKLSVKVERLNLMADFDFIWSHENSNEALQNCTTHPILKGIQQGDNS